MTSTFLFFLVSSVSALLIPREVALDQKDASSQSERSVPLVAVKSSAKNLCANGKWLPQLYLLGAQKAGTSTLARDLMRIGVRTAAGPKTTNGWIRGQKEWHFLEQNPTRDGFYQALPKCPDEFGVIADFTPENLLYCNASSRLNATVLTWPKQKQATRDVDVPGLIRAFYGAALSKQAVMVVMMRNPLSRMQAAWYRTPPDGAQNNREEWLGKDFRSDVYDTVLAAQSKPPVYYEWLLRSMYVHSLTAYLNNFASSQFIVVPTGLYSLKRQEVLQGIMDRLGAESPAISDLTPHDGNSDPHPLLDDDIDNATRSSFEEFMRPHNEALLVLLAQMSTDGAYLIGLQSSDRPHAVSKQEVRTWLFDNW